MALAHERSHSSSVVDSVHTQSWSLTAPGACCSPGIGGSEEATIFIGREFANLGALEKTAKSARTNAAQKTIPLLCTHVPNFMQVSTRAGAGQLPRGDRWTACSRAIPPGQNGFRLCGRLTVGSPSQRSRDRVATALFPRRWSAAFVAWLAFRFRLGRSFRGEARCRGCCPGRACVPGYHVEIYNPTNHSEMGVDKKTGILWVLPVTTVSRCGRHAR